MSDIKNKTSFNDGETQWWPFIDDKLKKGRPVWNGIVLLASDISHT